MERKTRRGAARLVTEMDEKDRHIVTFGGAPEVESRPDAKEESRPDAGVEGRPDARPGEHGRIDAKSDFSYDVDLPDVRDIPEFASVLKEASAPVLSTEAPAQKIEEAEAPVLSTERPAQKIEEAEAAKAVPAGSGDAAPTKAAGPVIRLDSPNYSRPASPAAPADGSDKGVTSADGAYKGRHEHNAYTGPQHAAPPAAKRQAAKAVNKEKKYVTKGLLVTFMIITMLVSSVLGAVFGAAFSQMTGGSAGRHDSELSQLDLSDATGSELKVSDIVKKNENSVVEIVVSGTTQGMWGQQLLTQGAGSGVIVTKDGYIATNHHVVEGATKAEVTLHNGKTYNATIIGSDPENDIAVIKIDAKDLTPVEIGDSSKVAVGDLAVAIGNPLGQLGGTATTGIISALDRTLNIEGINLTLLQTDAAINGGNSGGGLFNSKGELIGIVESKAEAVGVEGLAFALPINSVSEIINDMIENGGSTKAAKQTPAVGVVISDVSEDNAQYYGLESAGVYIAQVTGTNAKNAGFKEKDRIISFNGKEIKSSSDFITLVRKCEVGDTVTIVVSRDGQEIEIKTELEELNATQAG